MVQVGRLLLYEDQPLFDLSEQVSGQAEQAPDLSAWPFGRVGCPLELQGWAGSGGYVFGSWDSASQSWGQTGSLHWTGRETRFHLF